MKYTFMNIHFKEDIRSSVVLFLVTLPLCLGIAQASHAPVIAGIIAGIVGGLVVGTLSGSHTSVSGPAAGLTIVVLTGLDDLQSYEAFLLAVMLAGILQFVLSKVRAGVLGDFIPGAVISGMLVAIGLLLVLKQIPHALGYDRVYEGDEEFIQNDGENTFTEIYYAILDFNPGTVIIAILSIGILVLWDKLYFRNFKFLKYIPSQLIVVLFGVLLNYFYFVSFPAFHLSGFHLSEVGSIDGGILSSLNIPDFAQIINPKVWKLAVTIALVASIETLLSIQAADKIDHQKRVTPANKELMAQGVGNMVSGLIGGLPLTAVIVRTSANINAGARTKMSAIFHGVLLLFSVLFLAPYINLIPKASLAAILIHVGLKLSKPSIFKDEYRRNMNRFLPFIITILAILFTDLLLGIIIGIIMSMFFIVRSNYKTSLMLYQDHNNYLLRFNKDVSFLNKKNLKKLLYSIPDNSHLLIDSTKADFVDIDIIETVDDFIVTAKNRSIRISFKTTATKPEIIFKTI